MSEPDWTDVKSVRAWLGKRYLVANTEAGSPFFQYLKDELANGNKIKGRETHLSRDEFLRWLLDTQGTRAFHYSIDAMRTPYYPEYVDPSLSESRSQSPVAQPGDGIGHQGPGPSPGTVPDHETSEEVRSRVIPTPPKSKPACKSESIEQPVLTASDDKMSRKRSRTKAPLRASVTESAKWTESEALRRQEERARTLRPRRKCKHGKTGKGKCCPLRQVDMSDFQCDLDIYHPYSRSRGQRLS